MDEACNSYAKRSKAARTQLEGRLVSYHRCERCGGSASPCSPPSPPSFLTDVPAEVAHYWLLPELLRLGACPPLLRVSECGRSPTVHTQGRLPL